MALHVHCMCLLKRIYHHSQHISPHRDARAVLTILKNVIERYNNRESVFVTDRANSFARLACIYIEQWGSQGRRKAPLRVVLTAEAGRCKISQAGQGYLTNPRISLDKSLLDILA